MNFYGLIADNGCVGITSPEKLAQILLKCGYRNIEVRQFRNYADAANFAYRGFLYRYLYSARFSHANLAIPLPPSMPPDVPYVVADELLEVPYDIGGFFGDVISIDGGGSDGKI